METVIIDGKQFAKTVRDGLKVRVENFVRVSDRPPGLGVIVVGDDPASEIYVRNKVRACAEVGITSEVMHLEGDVRNDLLETYIQNMNDNPDIDAFLLQLPLPNGQDPQRYIDMIDPEKDADGFSPENLGRLMSGCSDRVVPCTPRAVMALIDETKVPLEGAHAVVVGRSNIVGKPVSLLLLERHATVTLCHSRTKHLKEICANADILVSAVGKPHLIGEGFIKPGAVVIDVGINRTENGLVGDVDFQAASGVAGYITPVPGGVGPVTVAMLLTNAAEAAGA